LLRKIGASSAIGSITLAAGTSTVSAASDVTISSDAWAEYEAYITDKYYSADTCGGDNCLIFQSAMDPDNWSVPNPETFGYDICVDLPNGSEVCGSYGGQLTETYKDCAGRYLYTVPLTMASFESEFDGGSVSWSQNFWIGIDSQQCLWLGLAGAGEDACWQTDCPEITSTTASIYEQRGDYESTINKAIEAIRNYSAGEGFVGTGEAAAAAPLIGGSGWLAAQKSERIPI